MKKLFLILITLLFAVSVYAEDRLSLSGTMRVRGFDMENYSNFDNSNDADSLSFYDQRFRMAAKIQVSEAVSANLRFDFDEDKWGSPDFDGYRPDADTELQVDRAYLSVDQENYTVAAGLMYFGLGNSIAFDANTHGLVLASKGFPVNVLFATAKISENGSYRDDSNTTDDWGDVDAHAINFNYSADNYAINAFYALVDNDSNGTTPVPGKATLIGLQGTYKTGMLSFNGELNIFGGDGDLNSTSSIDYVGTQFYGNVEAAINDQLTVGADILYASGTDKADEMQLTELADFGSWGVMDRGALVTDIVCNSHEFDVARFEDKDADDKADRGAGSTGLGLYANYKAMDNLLVQGGLVYLTPQEDDATNIDKVYSYNLSAIYNLTDDAALALAYNMVSVDKKSDATDKNDDSASALVCRLEIGF